MTTRTSTDLHTEHLEWWGELCSWQENVRTFERRLGRLLPAIRNDDDKAMAEHYQNRLIREQEVIDELQHVVKTHEDSLAKKAQETPHVAASAPYKDHEHLRQRMDTARHLHEDLRDGFVSWAASIAREHEDNA